MTKRSKVSDGSLVRFLAETYIFVLNFSLVFRFLQLGGALVNEIKNDHSPIVIVILDPRYD